MRQTAKTDLGADASIRARRSRVSPRMGGNNKGEIKEDV